MALNDFQFNVFKECYANDIQPSWISGHDPKKWGKWICDNGGNLNECALEAIPEGKLMRDNLLRFIHTKDHSTEACALSILAWGGMNRKHGKSLFETKDSWLRLCEDIRAGNLTRAEAYRGFKELREANKLQGMGPAYFTKLIFFLDPKHDGYIMDKWTATSVNLLWNPWLIKLSAEYYVTDRNTEIEYEKFCQVIERIATELNLSPVIVEERLFSSGGRKSHPWRRHVKDYRATLRH